MYSTLLTVALFFAPVFASYAINEPELVQCQTAKISWPPTTGPYNVIAVAASDPCGEPLAEIGDFDKTFVEWQVSLAAGTVVQLSVADSKDAEAWTGNITVTGGDDKSCLPGASSSAPAAAPTSNLSPSGNTGSGNTGSTGSTTGDDKTVVDPVGAANAGSNNFLDGAAPSSRQFSKPALALGAVAAIVGLAL